MLDEELGEELVVPPDAEESFFVGSDDDDALEDEDGELGVVVDAEPEAEPEGELGVVVVEPEDDDAPEPGVVVREVARSPLSQAVRIPAPSARDTATARAESLIAMGLRGWGETNGARFRPDAVPS